MDRCLANLPAHVRAERDDMALQLIAHVLVSRERMLAENGPGPHASWHGAATGLIDALTGSTRRPITTRGR